MMIEALEELVQEAIEAGDYLVASVLSVLQGAMLSDDEVLKELADLCGEFALKQTNRI